MVEDLNLIIDHQAQIPESVAESGVQASLQASIRCLDFRPLSISIIAEITRDDRRSITSAERFLLLHRTDVR
jgi:hypothetical protein